MGKRLLFDSNLFSINAIKVGTMNLLYKQKLQKKISKICHNIYIPIMSYAGLVNKTAIIITTIK